MTSGTDRFEVGVDFSSVLEALSRQIYDTPYAFIRENLQNAIDASRMQAQRQGILSSNESLRIDITAAESHVLIRDRGIGMSADDLRNLFWTIGASGKRNEEARAAGCVGMFGIGGFANLGVCETLIVTSQTETMTGQRTQLGQSDIKGAAGLPRVEQQPSDQASPRGTIIEGILQKPTDVNGLRQYVQDIVRFCHEPIYFNGDLLSGQRTETVPLLQTTSSLQTWSHEDIEVAATIGEVPGKTLVSVLDGLSMGGIPSRLSGVLRYEGNGIDILKQGFKICSTSVTTRIGVSGFIDCDLLSPTAGRDSLNAESNALVAKIVAAMERSAVLTILDSSDLIDQHTRIFQYIRSHGLVDWIGKVTVQSGDGQWLTLEEVRIRASEGAQVYFGTSTNTTLANILQTRGHVVLNLPGDNHKAAAIREYLSAVGATDLAGQVECDDEYTDLSRFEKGFLSELAETITEVYQVQKVRLIPGSLTEDIPVFVANPLSSASTPLRIFVDVRHQEVAKLAQLGMTSLFRSMVSAFCREYLGPALRSRSPKFFGSGAVNLDWLAQRRSELWVLLNDDIAVVNRSVRRQVVTASDIHVITAPDSSASPQHDDDGISNQSKLVKIDGGTEFEALDGYYLRIPNGAAEAYGDVIVDNDDRGANWMGNKITFVASDSISTAFQFEIRLDRLLIVASTRSLSHGAVMLDRPIQQLFGGLYFPVPGELEEFLVPFGNQQVRIEVWCDWLDFAGSRSWEAREETE